MAAKLEVEDIPHANVDDTQEALILLLELLLVEYLNRDDAIFICPPILLLQLIQLVHASIVLTYRMLRSSKDSEFA